MSVDHRLHHSAVNHSAAVLALVDELRSARAVQWEAPPTASMRTELDLHADPVGEAVANGSRLKLRAAVETALFNLDRATRVLEASRAAVAEAACPFVVRQAQYRQEIAA
jgi:hypothetical protein